MLINTAIAQQLITNHGKTQVQNEVAIRTECSDKTGKPFNILQFNNGACSVTDFTGKLLVDLEG